jgi:hypothetical protein
MMGDMQKPIMSKYQSRISLASEICAIPDATTSPLQRKGYCAAYGIDTSATRARSAEAKCRQYHRCTRMPLLKYQVSWSAYALLRLLVSWLSPNACHAAIVSSRLAFCQHTPEFTEIYANRYSKGCRAGKIVANSLSQNGCCCSDIATRKHIAPSPYIMPRSAGSCMASSQVSSSSLGRTRYVCLAVPWSRLPASWLGAGCSESTENCSQLPRRGPLHVVAQRTRSKQGLACASDAHITTMPASSIIKHQEIDCKCAFIASDRAGDGDSACY